MAHFGQELALGLDRSLGVGFGAAQFRFGGLVVADVLNGAGVTAASLGVARFIANRGRAAGHPVGFAFG